MHQKVAPSTRRPFAITATLALLGIITFSASSGQSSPPKYTVVPLRFEGSAWFLAAGDDAMWIPNPKIGSVSRVDPATMKVTPIWVHEAWMAPLGPNRFSVINAAVTNMAVWVADEGAREVVRIDPKTNTVTARISLGDKVPLFITVGGGAIWVNSRRTGHLIRIDPTTNSVTTTLEMPGAGGMFFSHGSLWVALGDETALARVDPKTNKVTATVKLDTHPTKYEEGCGHCLVTVTADDDAVWALGWAGRVWRVNPVTNAVKVLVEGIESKDLKSKKVDRMFAQGIAAGGGAVWVAFGAGSERLARIDPNSGKVELVELPGLVNVPAERANLTFAFGSTWLSADSHNTVWRVTRAP